MRIESSIGLAFDFLALSCSVFPIHYLFGVWGFSQRVNSLTGPSSNPDSMNCYPGTCLNYKKCDSWNPVGYPTTA